MKCLDWLLKYIGPTGTIYKEHIRAIRHYNSNSGYSNHILNSGHKHGTVNRYYGHHKTTQKWKTLKHTRKILTRPANERYKHQHILPNIQSITGNKRQIVAHNTSYILGSNTIDIMEASTMNDHDS
jgi:hypothetical protein